MIFDLLYAAFLLVILLIIWMLNKVSADDGGPVSTGVRSDADLPISAAAQSPSGDRADPGGVSE